MSPAHQTTLPCRPGKQPSKVNSHSVAVLLLYVPCKQKSKPIQYLCGPKIQDIFERDEKMQKIRMLTPLVEMDGDEMTRVLWQQIKDKLILPHVDLQTEYFDLGLKHRDETNDQVTVESALAAQRLGVAVKCATITPNAQRVQEYNLKQMWKSPNGTIRAILDGTVFRAPVLVKGISPCVPNWKKPIIIARHAYGDVYKNVEFRVPDAGLTELCYTDASGAETRLPIHQFKGAGIIQGLHNTDESITSFAHSCFQYALYAKQDLWFSTKDTISKVYDHHFKDVFEALYQQVYREDFQKAGITYFYTLIDDAVARVIRSEGGFIWALKNYDGDVMSDMIATAFGSLAMVRSLHSSGFFAQAEQRVQRIHRRDG